MTKTIYEAPSTKVLEVRALGSMLTNSTEAMHTVAGYWDEDDE